MLTPDEVVLYQALEPVEREALRRAFRDQLERYLGIAPSPAVWARLARSLDHDDQRLN
jgi:hypothetical protein